MNVFFGSKPNAIMSRMLSSEYLIDCSKVRSFFTKNFSSSDIGI